MAQVLDSTTNPAAKELFEFADLLEREPQLCRRLADPAAAAERKQQLITALLQPKLSKATLVAVAELVSKDWRNGAALRHGVEAAGVRAALVAAQTAGELDRVQAELFSFQELVRNDTALLDALREPRASRQAKAELARSLAGNAVSSQAMLLIERAAGRQATLQQLQQYQEIAAELAGQQIAKVTVARPLDAARQERLRNALAAKVGQPVLLQIHVDPAVVGGMSVHIGDNIFESTVARRLQDARRHLHTT